MRAARIVALFLSLLSLANLLGNGFAAGSDPGFGWVRFGSVPAWLSVGAVAIGAITLFAFSVRPPDRGWRRRWTLGVALCLIAVALANAIEFYRLMGAGMIEPGFPIPFSLCVCAGMLLVARAAWRSRPAMDRAPFWPIAAGGIALSALYPLALMLFFGNTDYRRPADAVVVFGARAYADGRLSDALQDRIRTACELWRAGLAKRLVLSGGPGDGAITEAAAMRQYALSQGVPGEIIFVDDGGLNTEATVRDTVPLLRQWNARRVLVVSHFYHLPRIKLTYRRAGLEVWTVPARQSHVLGQLPFNLTREVAAFWVYFWKV